MQNFIKTIINGVQKWTKKEIKKSTADWNQNDENAADYVKDRTHWEEKKRVTLVDNLTFADYDSGNAPKCNFVPGQKYDVIWNGVLYEGLVCWFDGEYNIIASSDNGCPFYIDDDGGDDLYISSDDDDDNWVVSIIEDAVVIHKLDSKYLDLPTNLATTDDVQEAMDTANEALNTANGKMDTNNPVGTGSFSMGRLSGTTVGNDSFAMGYSVTASGNRSHAEGGYTKASGTYSHAEGYNTKAESSYSHAEGSKTTASGDSSHAEGHGTTAACEHQHVQGKYNVVDTQYYLNIQKQSDVILDKLYVYRKLSFDPNSGEIFLDDPSGIQLCDYNLSDHIGCYVCKDNNFYKITGVGSSNGVNMYNRPFADVEKYTAFKGRYAHIVGNGTSDTACSNAHTLDWNGVGWFQGGLQVGGNAQDDSAKNVLLEGDAIPIPENATVGQVISVKAVDENGKPVEWEATDISTSGGSGCVVSDTAPEDTSVLWVDTADNSDDTLQDAVNIALAQAKDSGEFKGDPGKTPEKGIDYYTDTDKAELVNAVISALPAWTGGSY